MKQNIHTHPLHTHTHTSAIRYCRATREIFLSLQWRPSLQLVETPSRYKPYEQILSLNSPRSPSHMTPSLVCFGFHLCESKTKVWALQSLISLCVSIYLFIFNHSGRRGAALMSWCSLQRKEQPTAHYTTRCTS